MRILITGGTGSLGNALVSRLYLKHNVIVFSRDEQKQEDMQRFYGDRLRYFIGDVRDVDRLTEAFSFVDLVIHAAALKRVDGAAHNPVETKLTNVDGTINVTKAAVSAGVKKVILISSDKAVAPENVYGMSKMAAELMAVHSNVYAAPKGTVISVVRYGNVIGSRGSVVIKWRDALKSGKTIEVTDERMTRFWLTLDQACQIVMDCHDHMLGGEIFVPILPSMKLMDLALAMKPEGRPSHGQWYDIVGLRKGGEKLHESLLTEDEIRRLRFHDSCQGMSYYIVEPTHRTWDDSEYAGRSVKMDDEFAYSSERNHWWLTIDEMKELIDD
jgi:UDP-N-acetylglucosamine 4,6-dehydratase